MRTLIILIYCWLSLTAASAALRVGRAAVDITPPPGIPLAGYYSVRLAEGTHDPLQAKAIVLEQDGTRTALVACDLVAVEDDIVAEARAEIQKRTGIRPDQVMISATHSHTGPLLRQSFLDAVEGKPLEIARAYRAALPAKIASSVEKAVAALQPAKALAGKGREESISFNRRFLMKDGTVGWNPGKMNPNIVQPAGPIDPEVAVVVFAPENSGAPLAAYVNFAMHLDTVGGTHFSADYPFTLGKILAGVKGPDLLTLFAIGCAGNINHIDVKSRTPQKGHGEAERLGTILAGEVIKTFTRLEPVAGPLRIRREIVKLDLAPHAAEDVERARAVKARFGKPGAPPFLDQVKAFRVLDVAGREGRPLEAEVQVIALGSDLAWVSLPGEIFTELGQAIKSASPFRHTIVTELANGWIGYVPDRKGFREGNYEAVSARCADGSGESLAEAAIALLKTVAASNGR